ncbi:hypothetical protein GCM10011611_18830 [Aliidongia dinghuensis]|uniref:Uncharacterized protein n=1 Tax=Aliidongia dinghuensis TaxID=1867774 RepID=A0A8J2YRT5_9PROT|nr:hypothetical protein [Aliidongia dinghuensis]GGF13374.1 hypothetical protein GCM10011611_18830 [Aliidongia dinghuensis]
MSDIGAVQNPSRQQVKQIHYAYLEVLYTQDYFRHIRNSRNHWVKPLNLVIALSGSASGATGFVGIVGHLSWLAWVCAPLTVLGAGLTAARKVYHWDEIIQYADKTVESYDHLAMEYRFLIDDINIKQQWTKTFETRAQRLRDARQRANPKDPPKLPIEQERAIQNAIKQRVDRSNWWLP